MVCETRSAFLGMAYPFSAYIGPASQPQAIFPGNQYSWTMGHDMAAQVSTSL
jgi:hypothetical protein